jgi:hypothetical protein
MMQKTYKLKLAPQTFKYLKKIKRKFKIRLSVGEIQEFNIKHFGLPEAAGYFFVVDGKEHIYVNNRQSYKNSHDLVVLHEIAHLLMHRYHLYGYSNQEESFANGFALAMASDMGLHVDGNMVLEMSKYSDRYYRRNKSIIKRKSKRK